MFFYPRQTDAKQIFDVFPSWHIVDANTKFASKKVVVCWSEPSLIRERDRLLELRERQLEQAKDMIGKLKKEIKNFYDKG